MLHSNNNPSFMIQWTNFHHEMIGSKTKVCHLVTRALVYTRLASLALVFGSGVSVAISDSVYLITGLFSCVICFALINQML